MVSPRVWRSRRFKSLSKNAQLLFLYLVTSEHQTMAGAYRLLPEYGAADLRWSIEEFSSTLEEVQTSGLVLYDHETTEVMIEGWFKFHPPTGKMTTKGISNSLEKIDSEELYEAGMRAFEDALQEQIEKNTQQQPTPHPNSSSAKANGVTPDKLLEQKRSARLTKK